MNTTISKFRIDANKLSSDKGQTTLFISDINKGNIAVPKQIKWNQVILPETWKLENATPPISQEKREVESIIEYNDGDVEIKF